MLESIKGAISSGMGHIANTASNVSIILKQIPEKLEMGRHLGNVGAVLNHLPVALGLTEAKVNEQAEKIKETQSPIGSKTIKADSESPPASQTALGKAKQAFTSIFQSKKTPESQKTQAETRIAQFLNSYYELGAKIEAGIIGAKGLLPADTLLKEIATAEKQLESISKELNFLQGFKEPSPKMDRIRQDIQSERAKLNGFKAELSDSKQIERAFANVHNQIEELGVMIDWAVKLNQKYGKDTPIPIALAQQLIHAEEELNQVSAKIASQVDAQQLNNYVNNQQGIINEYRAKLL